MNADIGGRLSAARPRKRAASCRPSAIDEGVMAGAASKPGKGRVTLSGRGKDCGIGGLGPRGKHALSLGLETPHVLLHTAPPGLV